MIPNSPPPTLPPKETWTQDFHNFLKICLQKDPRDRPTAEHLLQVNALSVVTPARASCAYCI